uniref:Uncharacterized protein n=1 Tax=Anguilla anguilla TaxID=7936 RepID=A0A0E9UN56_ANGAN
MLFNEKVTVDHLVLFSVEHVFCFSCRKSLN